MTKCSEPFYETQQKINQHSMLKCVIDYKQDIRS